MNVEKVLEETLLVLLDGCSHAAALMPWGKPGPIRLPETSDERIKLIRAHLAGKQATVTYCPKDHPIQRKQLKSLVLFAYCPASDDLCRWVGIDLDDASGHGPGALVCPQSVAACIAERADAAGLSGGLFVATSKKSLGRHIWLIPPEPVCLADAVLIVAGLAARAKIVADEDAAESGQPHAFLCGDGSVGVLGASGTVELLPQSTDKPRLGWLLMLPAAGSFAGRGGGVIVDPFATNLTARNLYELPQCDPAAWRVFLNETQADLAKREPQPAPARVPKRYNAGDPLSRIDPRTRTFLDGLCPVGQRDRSLFISVCNLIGVGVAADLAERLAMVGALACGLPEREARATIRSAMRAKGIH